MKNKLNLLTLFLCGIFVSGCSAGKNTTESDIKNNTYTMITASEAKQMINENEGYIILDVRTRAEFEQGHISGALLLPSEEIGTENIPMLLNKEQLILVYCRSGNRSKQASQKLVGLGYTNVYEFGGIIDWPYGTVTGNE